jgi:hypothetical protein
MTDIVERLRDQCCRLGHDDHGHTNCWLFGRAAAEIERLRAENTTLRERTTPPDDIDVASLVDLLRDLAHDETDSLVDAALAIEHAYLSGDTPRGAAGE